MMIDHNFPAVLFETVIPSSTVYDSAIYQITFLALTLIGFMVWRVGKIS